MSSPQFCLKCKDHRSTIGNRFAGLLRNEKMVDVTLVCDREKVKAHKVVLAAYSPYFQEIFEENPCQHPVVIFKGFSSSLLRLVIQFIYEGTVNIDEEHVKGFMEMAETFQVVGLETAELDSVSNENCFPGSSEITIRPVNVPVINSVSVNDRPKELSAIQLDFVNPTELGIACDRMLQSTVKPLPLTTLMNNTTVPAAEAVTSSEMDTNVNLNKMPNNSNAKPLVRKHYVQLTKSKKKQILNLRYDESMITQKISKIVNISEERVINFLKRNPSFTSVPSPKKTQATAQRKNRLSLSSPNKKASILKAEDTSVLLPSSPNVLASAMVSRVSAIAVGPTPVPNGAILEACTSSEQQGSNPTMASPENKKTKMSYSRLTAANRRRVLDLYDEKMKADAIAQQLNLSVNKVKEYIMRFNGETPSKSKRQKLHKLDAKNEARLLNYIGQQETITQAQIQTYIKRKHGIAMSIKAISKLLKLHNVVLKRPLSQNYSCLNPEQEQQLLSFIRNNKKVTRAQIHAHLKKENLTVSQFFISRFLKKHEINLSRSLRNYPMGTVAQNSLSNIELRYNYAVNMTELRTRRTPFVFVDECIIEAKSDAGSLQPETTNYYILLAMNAEKGFLRKVYQKKGFNGDNFIEFVDQVHSLLPVARHAFVMSNTCLHRAEKVKQWVHDKGHEQVFLPSCSPFMNPLDKLFKKLRIEMRHCGTDNVHSKFGQQLQEYFVRVTKDDCCSWIQNTFEYFPQCLLKSPILNATLAVGSTCSQDPENGLAVTMENDQKSASNDKEQSVGVAAKDKTPEKVIKAENLSGESSEPMQGMGGNENSLAVPAKEVHVVKIEPSSVEVIEID